MNLLAETIADLREHNLTTNDIVLVTCDDFDIPIEHFLKIADVEYDNGFGSPHVATDLKIVGNGWWLERREYDGSEWWECKEPPKKKGISVTVARVIDPCSGWLTVEEMNSDD